jgi:hypothetical protein
LRTNTTAPASNSGGRITEKYQMITPMRRSRAAMPTTAHDT